MKTYTCESCGAKLLVSEISHVTECLYCGNTIVIHNEEIDNLNIKKIIPFQIEKEEAMEKISYYTSDKPIDAKKVYVPVKFSSFQFDFLYYFRYREEERDDSGTTVSYHNSEQLLEGEANREIIFGTSKINNIQKSYEYNNQEILDYNPSLVQDVSIEISNFDNINLQAKQKERLKEYAKNYFRRFDIVKVFSENYFITNSKIDSYTTLVPVYIVKTNTGLIYNVTGIKITKKKINTKPRKVGIIVYIILSLIFTTLLKDNPNFLQPLLIVLFFIIFPIVIVKELSSTPFTFKNEFSNFKSEITYFIGKRKKLK